MRILLVAPSLPLPATWGFNIRVFNLLRGLAAENSVSLLCYGDADTEADAVRQLGAFCDRIYLVPHAHRSLVGRRLAQAMATVAPESFHLHRYATPQMQAELTKVLRTGGYDLVQVESSAMATFDFSGAQVVLDEHNLEYELLIRGNEVERSPARRAFGSIECRKVEREEEILWRRASGCLVTSNREEAVVNHRAPGVPTAVVPNGVDLDYFQPRPTPLTKGSIVFTGLMTYRPNADGVRHFVTDILPRIRQRSPQAAFTAVGWGLPSDMRSILGDGVVHTGRVDDVRPYLAQASVVVVPLRIGSGTRLKVLEALAMGKAVVSTSIGCEGLDLRHGTHALVADDPPDFAAAVLRLFDDPNEAAELGRRGRELVERQYGWESSVARLLRFHASLIAPTPERAAVAPGLAL